MEHDVRHWCWKDWSSGRNTEIRPVLSFSFITHTETDFKLQCLNTTLVLLTKILIYYDVKVWNAHHTQAVCGLGCEVPQRPHVKIYSNTQHELISPPPPTSHLPGASVMKTICWLSLWHVGKHTFVFTYKSCSAIQPQLVHPGSSCFLRGVKRPQDSSFKAAMDQTSTRMREDKR